MNNLARSKMNLRNLGSTPTILTYLTTTDRRTMFAICSQKLGGGYEGKPSIFDQITPDDLVLAFFPCTRFESKIPLAFRGEARQQKKWSIVDKLEYSMKLHEELHRNYMLISKMSHIAIKRRLRLVIENPYTQPHYLTTYWCIKPRIIDTNRRLNGDYYEKPTQFWFLNFEPKQNLVFEPIDYVEKKIIKDVHNTAERSEIHPQYASRFIRQYLID